MDTQERGFSDTQGLINGPSFEKHHRIGALAEIWGLGERRSAGSLRTTLVSLRFGLDERKRIPLTAFLNRQPSAYTFAYEGCPAPRAISLLHMNSVSSKLSRPSPQGEAGANVNSLRVRR
jgi:hypothetical protein